MKKQNGFTLIELMVVFVIIIILAGLVMNLVTAAMQKANKADTKAKLEMVAQALEEFRAINGRYPPVPYYDGEGQHFKYEYAELDLRPTAMSSPQNAIYPELATYIKQQGGGTTLYRFGLMAYLCPRYKGAAENSPASFVGYNDNEKPAWNYVSQTYSTAANAVVSEWGDYNYREGKITDSAQDLESARRILPFLGATMNTDGSIRNPGIISQIPWQNGASYTIGSFTYHNPNITIRDAWNRDLLYESKPPYDSYKLWSYGPDGRTGIGNDGKDYSLDDIVVTQD